MKPIQDIGRPLFVPQGRWELGRLPATVLDTVRPQIPAAAQQFLAEPTAEVLLRLEEKVLHSLQFAASPIVAAVVVWLHRDSRWVEAVVRAARGIAPRRADSRDLPPERQEDGAEGGGGLPVPVGANRRHEDSAKTVRGRENREGEAEARKGLQATPDATASSPGAVTLSRARPGVRLSTHPHQRLAGGTPGSPRLGQRVPWPRATWGQA